MDFTGLLALTDRATLDSSLGGAVTYAPSVGDSVTVRGVFDSAYQLADAGTPGVSTSVPAVFLLLSDLPSDPETDNPTITVSGDAYTIRETQKDGLGGVLILMHKV